MASKYGIEVGDKFERLTVISGNWDKQTWWLKCKCDCGNIRQIKASKLYNGNNRSCGCLGIENRINKSRCKDGTFRYTGSIKTIHRKCPVGNIFISTIMNDYMIRCRKNNLSFNLTGAEFSNLIESNCHYCNKTPSNIKAIKGYKGSFKYNGIDRLNPNQGYNSLNCVPCCKFCNLGKNIQMHSDYLIRIKAIYENLNLQHFPITGDISCLQHP